MRYIQNMSVIYILTVNINKYIYTERGYSFNLGNINLGSFTSRHHH